MRAVVDPIRHRLARRTRIVIRGLEARRDRRLLPEILASMDGALTGGRGHARWSVRRTVTTAGGLSVVLVGSGGSERVVKIGSSAETRVAVRRESCVLRALVRRPDISDLMAAIPQPIASGRIDGRSWAAQTTLAGRPLSTLPADRQTRLATHALALAGELHRATSRRLAVDARLLDRWVTRRAALVSSLLQPVDASALPSLRALATGLAEAVAGAELDISWVHGDYWAGNVLIDGDDRVSGIVDWDSARSRELPTHDVNHFLISWQRAVSGATWGAAVREALETGQPTREGIDPARLTTPIGHRASILLYWLFTIEANHRRHPPTIRSRRWIEANIVHVLEAPR